MSADGMKKVYALETIDAGSFIVPAGEYGEFEAAEADRLVALGAAVDPDKVVIGQVEQQPMVSAEAHVAVVAELDALKVEVEAKDAEIAASKAALTEANAEIDRLTKALAKAEKK